MLILVFMPVYIFALKSDKIVIHPFLTSFGREVLIKTHRQFTQNESVRKMNMVKRLAVLFMSAALALSFCACGSSDSPESAAASSAASSSAASVECQVELIHFYV